MTQLAIREMVDEASELIGKAVWPDDTVFPEGAGIEASVGATIAGVAAEVSVGDDVSVDGEGVLSDEPGWPGVRFAVALPQLALYPANVFSEVGLMAKFIPDWQCLAWEQ